MSEANHRSFIAEMRLKNIMAKIFNNIFVRGLTGAVGDQFVMRQTRDGETIISNKPRFRAGREFTEQQKEHQKAFRDATTYAKSAKDQPAYQEQAALTRKSAYNIAVKDWFGKPEVLEIDTSEWTGKVGETIHVRAQDNIGVARVYLQIDNGNGTTFEQGPAEQGHDLWWRYTTTTAVSLASAPRIVAIARDLPGHTSELVWQNN